MFSFLCWSTLFSSHSCRCRSTLQSNKPSTVSYCCTLSNFCRRLSYFAIGRNANPHINDELSRPPIPSRTLVWQLLSVPFCSPIYHSLCHLTPLKYVIFHTYISPFKWLTVFFAHLCRGWHMLEPFTQTRTVWPFVRSSSRFIYRVCFALPHNLFNWKHVMPLIQKDHSFVWYLTQTMTPLVSTHHTFSYHFFTVYPTCLSPCLILTCPPPHPTFSVSIRVGPHTFKILHLQTSLPWHVLHFRKIHTQNPRSPHLLPNRPVVSRILFLNHPLPLRFTFLRTRTSHWKGTTVHTQSLPTTTHLTTRS